MPTFTAPTYRIPFNDEKINKPRHLMRWFSLPVGYTVLITGGVATPLPGRTVPTVSELAAADAGSGDGGKAVFSNGVTYTITSGEQTILEAAGYTVDA
jgi:hypothetical protein